MKTLHQTAMFGCGVLALISVCGCQDAGQSTISQGKPDLQREITNRVAGRKVAPQPISINDLPWRELLADHIPPGLDEQRLERMMRHLELDDAKPHGNGLWRGHVVWRSRATFTLSFDPAQSARVALGAAVQPDEIADALIIPASVPTDNNALKAWLAKFPQRADEFLVRPTGTDTSIPLTTYGGLALGSRGIVAASLSSADKQGVCALTLTSDGESYPIEFAAESTGAVMKISRLISIQGVSPANFLEEVSRRYRVVEGN